MDNSTPDIELLLVQYLDGQLPEAEKENVEKQLAANAVLRQQFDSLLLTRESIRHYGLKEKVSSIHQEMMKEIARPAKKLSSSRRIIRYTIAAAASILLLIGGYFAYNIISLSSDKVYVSNYQKFELSVVRDNSVIETPAEIAYKAGKYKEVLRIHDADEDHTPKTEFLCGVAALELNDNKKAILCFNEVLEANKKTSAKILNDEAEYYLSLGYVKNKDYNNALAIMNKIKDDPEHIYNEKITRKLIRQVKMLKWQ